MSTWRKLGRPEMGTSQSICFYPNMMGHRIQTKKQCQASFWILCLHWLLVKREGPGSQRSWFPLTKSAKKACPSFRSYLEALSISGDSQSIVVIEEAFSFKISSSIDSKKNYFNQLWIANAGLLEVQGLPRSCSVDNTYRQKKTIHTQSQLKKIHCS